jgi:hypothetical protein
MANTRQQIVDALDTRLQTITTLNGYSANLGVYEWLVTPLEEADLPAVVFRDTVDDIDDEKEFSRLDHTLTVELDVAASSTASADSVRELIKDILTAIGTDKEFGGLAYNTDVLTASLEVSEADQRLTGGQIIIEIKYRTALWEI